MSESIEPTPSVIILPKPHKLSVNGTIALSEANTEEEFKLYFKHNLDKFPHVRFRQWLDGQRVGIQRASKICPPTRLYRLRSDGRLAAVTGYKSDGDNDARVAIMALGEEVPQFVDPTQLQDASAELRREAQD